MTTYFIGGAAGSALGIFAWNHGGWSMTCLAGVGLVVFCILFSVIDAFLQKSSWLSHNLTFKISFYPQLKVGYNYTAKSLCRFKAKPRIMRPFL